MLLRVHSIDYIKNSNLKLFELLPLGRHFFNPEIPFLVFLHVLQFLKFFE